MTQRLLSGLLREIIRNRSQPVAVALVTLSALACSLGEQVASAPTVPPRPPTALPPLTRFATPLAQIPQPDWWPTDLPMPIGAAPISGPKGRATWTTGDTHVDRLRDFFLKQAQSAGYQTFTVALSPGSIYDLLLVKGGTTFALNLTQGSDATILTGRRIGTMHLDVSGAMTLSIDLPLRDYVDVSPTSEIAFGTDIPNAQCAECEYLIYVHIAPFNGLGVYQSKPAGIYLIDAELVPGMNSATEDYRWAQQCTVLVPDSLSGSFACAGLENVNDSSKKVNVTGKWQQPPATP